MELIKQQDEFDCGITNCVMIVNHYLRQDKSLELYKLENDYLRQEYSLEDIKKY